MEVVVELVVGTLAESVGLVLNLTVGLGLASATYWMWLAVRRRLWRLDQPMTVKSPDGTTFLLHVSGLRVQTPLSRRVFGADAVEEPRRQATDRLHPDRLVDRMGDLLFVVMPFVFVAVMFLVVLFLLELILAVVVLGVFSASATIIRHRWTCRVTDRQGRVVAERRARGLRRIHRVRDELAETIRTGVVPASEGASPG